MTEPNTTEEFQHYVQFYDDEDVISTAAADFLLTGFTGSEPIVLITTAPRRRAIEARLARHGVDLDAVHGDGRAVFSDARDTLAAFMVGENPDPARFMDVMQAILERCASGSATGRMRVFGDMVDLLCQDGLPDAAIRLEELWHQLARTRGFALFCAYYMGNFYREVNGRIYQQICAQHSQVLPATAA